MKINNNLWYNNIIVLTCDVFGKKIVQNICIEYIVFTYNRKINYQ